GGRRLRRRRDAAVVRATGDRDGGPRDVDRGDRLDDDPRPAPRRARPLLRARDRGAVSAVSLEAEPERTLDRREVLRGRFERARHAPAAALLPAHDLAADGDRAG